MKAKPTPKVEFPVTVVVFESDRSRAGGFVSRTTPTLGVRDRLVIVRPTPGATEVRELPRSTPRSPLVVEGSADLVLEYLKDRTSTPGLVLTLDTIVVQGRWLEVLRAALATAKYGVIAPRSTCIDGPQRIFLSEGVNLSDRDTYRRFNHEWERTHRELITSERYVSSRVFAMETERFFGALDCSGLKTATSSQEILELAYLKVVTSQSIAIAHGSVVHAEEVVVPEREAECISYRGSKDDPYISACLIVKDEEEFLPQCLDALKPMVDEIVVVDTGSTDGTVDIARSYGALVYFDGWRDDFSYSRNIALEHCSGKWIVWVDADEVLEGDPKAFRELLNDVGDKVEGFTVRISNEVGSGLNPSVFHTATRVFRRADLRWSGALHEQVWSRLMDRTAQSMLTEVVTIAHKGYLESVMKSKDKAQRNLSAVTKGAGGAAGWEEDDINTARSLMMTHDYEEAKRLADRVLRNGVVPTFRYLALHVLVDCHTSLGTASELTEYFTYIPEIGLTDNASNVFWARMYLCNGEFQNALDCFRKITTKQIDFLGMETSPLTVATDHAKCLIALERYDEATELLLQAMSTKNMAFHLELLIDVLDLAHRDASVILDAMPPGKENMIFAQLLQISPTKAQSVLEDLFHQGTKTKEVLATASLVARKGSMSGAVRWSQRLRDAGLINACPLRYLAAQHTVSPEVARQAQKALREFFGEVVELPGQEGSAVELSSFSDKEFVVALKPGSALVE